MAARTAWRSLVLVVGIALVGAGVALLVLPGPGILVVLAGLAVLASEFPWARRALHWVRARARTAVRDLRYSYRSARPSRRRLRLRGRGTDQTGGPGPNGVV